MWICLHKQCFCPENVLYQAVTLPLKEKNLYYYNWKFLVSKCPYISTIQIISSIACCKLKTTKSPSKLKIFSSKSKIAWFANISSHNKFLLYGTLIKQSNIPLKQSGHSTVVWPKPDQLGQLLWPWILSALMWQCMCILMHITIFTTVYKKYQA